MTLPRGGALPRGVPRGDEDSAEGCQSSAEGCRTLPRGGGVFCLHRVGVCVRTCVREAGGLAEMSLVVLETVRLRSLQAFRPYELFSKTLTKTFVGVDRSIELSGLVTQLDGWLLGVNQPSGPTT
jgi:hypothetical protein